MWRYARGVLLFLVLLVLLPLVAAFLVKLLIVAGTWTLETITEPPYAIAAGVTFLAVLAVGIWFLVALGRGAVASARQVSPNSAPGRPTAYCNGCGKLNWADVPTCHYCHAPM